MRLIDANELKHARFHMDKYYTKVIPYSIESEESKASAYMLGWNDALDAVMDSAPTIDAVPVRHGEWEFAYEDTNEELIFECSICKGFSTRENFCPHCGADMRGKEDD